MASENVAVISSPAGWHGDWHPTPHRQLMIVLAGELEVQVSDGEVRRFGPGATLLVEDTVGRGHVSSVVGTQRCFMVNVVLSDAEVEITPDPRSPS
ncbi:MAG: cupin domain-containing protein [Holophagae bacterium]